MSKAAEGEMTIRELAERTGMTVRNIRAHQTRGLLPPPVVRGRTGYYNEEHVARVALTREMQADGLSHSFRTLRSSPSPRTLAPPGRAA